MPVDLSKNERRCLLCLTCPQNGILCLLHIIHTLHGWTHAGEIWIQVRLWIALQKLDFLTLERAIFTFVQVESFSLGFLLSLCCTFLFFIRLFIAVAAPLKCAKLICLTLFEKADLSHRPLLQASRVCQRAHISHCKVKEVLIKGHVRGTTAWTDICVFMKVKESKQENLNCSSHSLTCSISLGFRSLRSSYSSLTYIQEKSKGPKYKVSI